MLKKREIFRQCFDNFEHDAVAAYGDADEDRILNTEGMIRFRRKIRAVIHNARCCRKLREEYESFSEYIRSWSGGRRILYDGRGDGPVPVSNGLSDRISRDMKKRGFQYLGPVTIYSRLQACWIINDHDKDCPFRQKIISRYPALMKGRDREVYESDHTKAQGG